MVIDTGVATHVCPIWFASTTQTYDIPEQERPNLRTATEDPIEVCWYKFVYVTNESNQQIVIPFYVRSVSQPILWVTRLTEQGFTIHLSEQPTITHPNGFEAKLRSKEGTYFLPVNSTGTPPNYKLDVHDTQQGIKATNSPITLTQKEHNGSHISTTFGHTTVKGTWWDSTKPNAEQRTGQTNNVQFQWTSLRITGEQ